MCLLWESLPAFLLKKHLTLQWTWYSLYVMEWAHHDVCLQKLWKLLLWSAISMPSLIVQWPTGIFCFQRLHMIKWLYCICHCLEYVYLEWCTFSNSLALFIPSVCVLLVLWVGETTKLPVEFCLRVCVLLSKCCMWWYTLDSILEWVVCCCYCCCCCCCYCCCCCCCCCFWEGLYIWETKLWSQKGKYGLIYFCCFPWVLWNQER